MAGYGTRFLKSGYKIYKPFLEISKQKTMIDNICDKFPKDINKFFIVSNLIKKHYEKKLKKIKNSKIIKIKHHKLGPVETLIRAEPALRKLENIFISYCDITWEWNFSKIRLDKNKIFCFKGWHPHTKDNNNYAFCKIKKNKELIKIKEKSSFTNNWQNEPLSIGLFFFLNSNQMLDSFKKIKEKKIKINSEYFPSLGFNFIKKTKIDFVEKFVHIGSPRYYEEYRNWLNFFNNKNNFEKKIKNTNISDEFLIPAAGEAKRFKKEGIHIPKYLIFLKVSKKRIIDYINSFLPNKKKRIIVLKKDYNKKFLNKKIFDAILLNNKTNGQAHTIFKTLNLIKNDRSLFINSCDVFSVFNVNKFLKLKKNADIILFVSSKSFQDLKDNEYTWVDSKKNNLLNLYIKNKPRKNLKILTGNFYFKNKNIFLKCFHKVFNPSIKEVYIDDIIKKSLELNYKVKVLDDDHYINFGTPSLLKDFIFWENYFKK